MGEIAGSERDELFKGLDDAVGSVVDAEDLAQMRALVDDHEEMCLLTRICGSILNETNEKPDSYNVFVHLCSRVSRPGFVPRTRAFDVAQIGHPPCPKAAIKPPFWAYSVERYGPSSWALG